VPAAELRDMIKRDTLYSNNRVDEINYSHVIFEILVALRFKCEVLSTEHSP
jgi:hypothetical protein